MATRRKDMIIVNDLRPGITFVYENNIYSVIEASHNKTAMRQMIIKAKARNLRSGSIIEISFTGGDKVEPAHIDKKEMQYLYDSGDALVFMDTNTYEQIEIQKSNMTWELNFLKPNDNVNISSYENEILGLILPDKVTLQIIETEPAIKGDTATNALKNATVETGLQVRVPMFIEQDEYIIVNTTDGKYQSRA
jgi:elongation factor P